MPYALALPDGYGYCVAVALGLIPVLSFYQGILVGKARKAAGVPYPNAYATAEQAKSNRKAYEFNCAQRAHHQLLENMTQTICYVLFAGAFHPLATSTLGALWVVFRVIFAHGYINGTKPNGAGRMWGAGFWLCQAGLWGMCLYPALTQLL